MTYSALIPAAVTVAAVLFAMSESRRAHASTEVYGPGAISAIAYLAAAVVALVAWLVWAAVA